MGQKVHPLGFRVGITKNHQSQWFARFHKHKYAQTVLEDRMLRETLANLFPQLLNPVLKKKRDDELSVIPKITQIKIERGLIPYEIGIQIHAENCDLIKSSIENLKVNRDLLCQLQKTRRYLQHLRFKLNNLTTISESNSNIDSLKGHPLPEGEQEKKVKVLSNNNSSLLSTQTYKGASFEKKESGSRYPDKRRVRKFLTKQQLRHQRLIFKRLKKRQSIRRRYRQLVAKGLFLTKKGSFLKIVQKFSKRNNLKNNSSALYKKERNQSVATIFKKNISANIFQSRIKKKFVSVFINRMNNKFLQSLKTLLRTFTFSLSLVPLELKNQQKQTFLTSLGWNKKWGPSFEPKYKQIRLQGDGLSSSKVEKISGTSSVAEGIEVLPGVPVGTSEGGQNNRSLNSIKKRLTSIGLKNIKNVDSLMVSPFVSGIFNSTLQHKSLSQLNKFIILLEQKSLKKMETLRKDYIALGSIPKTEAYNYYQMLNFLKQVKELVSQIKRKQKFPLLNSSYLGARVGEQKNILQKGNVAMVSSLEQTQIKEEKEELFRKNKTSPLMGATEVTMNLLSKKFNNIDNECRKMKFIGYLKQIVKKHRTNNIYLYLSTIADARKDLRKLQQFTKRNASFLFGLNSLANYSTDSNSVEQKGSLLLPPGAEERISNVLQQINMKQLMPISGKSKQGASMAGHRGAISQQVSLDSNKTLSEIFLEQIEKQRNMFKDNVQLTPKIAIKFYSVNSKTLKAKASVIADSIVDALEKRKAFRKVIKDAKEELMRTPGIKGVKIQVAGRLNGAEIARSEWVRAGRVPLQTLRANLDYSYKTANTIYGIIGIKVWIFKGYTKLI